MAFVFFSVCFIYLYISLICLQILDSAWLIYISSLRILVKCLYRVIYLLRPKKKHKQSLKRDFFVEKSYLNGFYLDRNNIFLTCVCLRERDCVLFCKSFVPY